MRALEAAAVADLMESERLLLDLRRPQRFVAGHPAGAVNLVFHRQQMLDRIRLFLPEGRPVVVLMEPDLIAPHACELLQEAGYSVEGWLAGGFAAWEAAGLPVSTVPTLTVADLRDQVAAGKMQPLDVREEHEYTFGHIAGAQHLPWHQVERRMAEIGQGGTVAVTCATENRSSTAVSLLLRQGYTNLAVVLGGMTAWTEAGYPQFRPE